MTDVVDSATRSRMMSGIRGKNTRPEIAVRKALHRAGLRFRLHRKDLPGKPDIVLPRYRAVIFVHGCFWHGHDCHLVKMPQTRPEFWRKKIKDNIRRDLRNSQLLVGSGWRVLRIWECALKGSARKPPEEVAVSVKAWLNSPESSGDIAGEHKNS